MATRKALITMSVSGIGSNLGLVSAAPGRSASTEADAIAAYGDPWVTNVPRTEGKTLGEMSFQFLWEGGNDTTLTSLVGTVQSVTIQPQWGDGKTPALTQRVEFDLAITGVEFGNVEFGSEHRATCTITGVPHTGPETTNSNSNANGNT